jgi:hypothetical protein
VNKYLVIGAAAAGLVLGFAVYRGAKVVGAAAVDAANAVNPLNNDNIINQGFTSVYQAVTGSGGTLGTGLYDITHDGTLNPASGNNVINRGVSGIGGYITGDDDWTLGGQIYDWTH